MSKERLAKMNKKVVGLIDGEDFSDLVQMDVDTYAWFYKQAERALKNADDLHVMDLQLASEQKQNKRYRRTLEFYADRKSWELGDPYEPRDCDAWRDQGSKARQALEVNSDDKN